MLRMRSGLMDITHVKPYRTGHMDHLACLFGQSVVERPHDDLELDQLQSSDHKSIRQSPQGSGVQRSDMHVAGLVQHAHANAHRPPSTAHLAQHAAHIGPSCLQSESCQPDSHTHESTCSPTQPNHEYRMSHPARRPRWATFSAHPCPILWCHSTQDWCARITPQGNLTKDSRMTACHVFEYHDDQAEPPEPAAGFVGMMDRVDRVDHHHES